MIRVLVVDDDKLARKGLISIVPWESLGMRVVGEASNGQKALDFLAEAEADLAVVDLAMPVMPGLEFIAACRRRYPAMKYVVLSFHEDFQNVQAALRLGALDYISKMRLDQQDCSEVFRRVRALIETSDRPAPQGARWDDLHDQWLAFHWLYIDSAFHGLVAATRERGPSPRGLEHLFVRLADQAARQFPWVEMASVPAIGDVDRGLAWIGEYRGRITEPVLQMENPESTEACILRAVCLSRESLASPISLEGMAQSVNLSRSHFAANFKRLAGVTFNQFLREARVERAMELLETGACPPGDVGQAVGYEDEKYFAQIFTRQTGLSPTEYAAEGR